jgi:release factor glutamine methyltransferase
VPELALPLAQKAAHLFSEKGIENARLEAELLLAHVLGIRRLDLYLQHDRPLTESQLEAYRGCVRRRLKREPLQHIIGRVQFRHLELAVDARALIPRPETELLVEEVVRYARERAEALRAIDLGVGSGAIALSIAHEAPNVSVVATDVAGAALELAAENADRLGLSLELRRGELWAVVASDERFDIVVSNPPYVAEHERPTLQPEVRDWEPAAALFGGDDGLQVIRALIAGAPAHMRPGALFALEIGMTQAAAVRDLVEQATSFENIRVVRDLSSRERIITALCRKQDG